MLIMIIFVLGLFKFLFTLNSFTRFPLRTNFIFVTVSYRSSSCAAGPCCCTSSSLTAAGSCGCYSSASFSTMSFNLSCCPYPIFSIVLLYNKEVVSSVLWSLSASASHVGATGADTPLYNFEIVFLKNVFIVLLIHF